jgi:hypothetical protein
MADLVVTQARQSDTTVEHTISWYPPTVGVAIGTNAFGGLDPNPVLSAMNQGEYHAVPARWNDFLSGSDLGATITDDPSQPAILFMRTAISSPPLFLKLKVEAKSLSKSQIAIIDLPSKKLVTQFEISSFSP